MTGTITNWYSSESARRELSNEYQHDRVLMFFKDLSYCALDASSLSIGRVKNNFEIENIFTKYLKESCW